MKTIQIPKELLWDYREPPNDLLWRLQRIADFFPAYGTERETVKLLFRYRGKLKLEEGTYKLIALYKEVWNKKGLKCAKVPKIPKINGLVKSRHSGGNRSPENL